MDSARTGVHSVHLRSYDHASASKTRGGRGFDPRLNLLVLRAPTSPSPTPARLPRSSCTSSRHLRRARRILATTRRASLRSTHPKPDTDAPCAQRMQNTRALSRLAFSQPTANPKPGTTPPSSRPPPPTHAPHLTARTHRTAPHTSHLTPNVDVTRRRGAPGSPARCRARRCCCASRCWPPASRPARAPTPRTRAAATGARATAASPPPIRSPRTARRPPAAACTWLTHPLT